PPPLEPQHPDRPHPCRWHAQARERLHLVHQGRQGGPPGLLSRRFLEAPSDLGRKALRLFRPGSRPAERGLCGPHVDTDTAVASPGHRLQSWPVSKQRLGLSGLPSAWKVHDIESPGAGPVRPSGRRTRTPSSIGSQSAPSTSTISALSKARTSSQASSGFCEVFVTVMLPVNPDSWVSTISWTTVVDSVPAWVWGPSSSPVASRSGSWVASWLGAMSSWAPGTWVPSGVLPNCR